MKKIFLLTLLVVLFTFSAVFSGWWLIQPVDASNTQQTVFVIPKGQAIVVIADRLADGKLIKHPLAFRIYSRFAGLDAQIQSGSFEISPSQSLAEIALELTKGTEDVWITILEGWRAEEIAEHLAKKDELSFFVADDFMALVQKNDAEGKLFPETYLIPKSYSSQQVFELLTSTFESTFERVLETADAEIVKSYSHDELVVMASLVQREAREYDQMQMVAGILWNRISLGMPLQVDATLQYVKGYNPSLLSWWSPPIAEDKELVSSFNTYLKVGLPPAPIANPGLDALRAVVSPTDTDNIFYLHARDGKMYFAESYDKHLQYIEQYLR